MIETTKDAFLGGALNLLQPKTGYRAGADPVLLASAVRARAGQSVLELGCGVGVALCCLMHRVPGLYGVGVERDEEMVELAKLNFSNSNLEAHAVRGDIAHLPEHLSQASFDHVIANPPFFDRAKGTSAQNKNREGGRGEGTQLSIWIDVATRRLRPGGHLTMIQRIARLGDVLSLIDSRLGSVEIVPLASRTGREPDNFIVVSRKGRRGALRMHAPFILHEGAHHDGDRDSYTQKAQAILREGESMNY